VHCILCDELLQALDSTERINGGGALNTFSTYGRWATAAVAALLLSSCGGGDPEPVQVADVDSRERPLSLPPGTPIPADANTKGLFGPLKTWPLIAVHGVMTSDGRILSYGTRESGQQTGFFVYDIWDPTDDSHMTLANGTAVDIFCSSQILLPNGADIAISGGDNWTGTGTTNTGNNSATLFNVETGAMTRASNMNRQRWYSSSTMLLNGEVYVQGGSGGTDRPEIRGTDGTYRLLSGANTGGFDSMYPRNFVAPDGRVFGYDSAGRMYYIDTSGTGTATPVAQFSSAVRGNDSSAAMFAPGRILQYGGSSNQAIVIDINGATPVITSTASMLRQRRLSTATLMADGKVVATGGSRVWNVMTDVSYEAEIWNPQTGQWTVGASAVKPRLYHGNALLLADATVLVFGGGAPSPSGVPGNLNAEIYYPPYLFTAGGTQAARPQIDSAPTVVDPGRTVQVGATSARTISRVTFVKTGSATHGWNMDQRFVDLPFNAEGGTLQVQIPARASDVPPGIWMMFVIDDAGVPSQAKLVRVNVAPSLNVETQPVISPPGNQSMVAGVGLSLQIGATDPNGDALRYSASGLPSGLSIDASTGLVSGTPNAIGTSTVVLAVSDGINSSSVTIGWDITSPAPVVLNPPTPPLPSVVGATTTFTTSATGFNVQYRWDFGDGTLSEWSAQPEASHAYSSGGVYYVVVTAIDAMGFEQRKTVMHNVQLALSANSPSVSADMLLEQRNGANARLWVANPDNDSVAVFDTVTRGKLTEISVGASPRTLALAPDGTVWVVNKRGASISVVSTASLTTTRTIALPRASQPHGIAMASASNSALVALEATGTLLKIDISSAAVSGSLPVGPNPRHVSVAADGATAWVSRFVTPPLPGESTATVLTQVNGQAVGGELVVVNSGTMSVLETVVLAHGNALDAENQGRGIPNYLGAAAISPDGSQAFVPSKQDNILRGGARDGLMLNFQSTVRAISSRIDMGLRREDLLARVDHDNASVASAAAYDPLGVYLFVALETSREVAVLDAHHRNELMRIDVGRAPQGIVVSPDRRTLYVHNFMDRTIGVFDLSPLIDQGLASATPVATLETVGTERLSATVLQGKRLFYDARDTRLARDRYMSCASCHNDGGHDGRVWDLTSQGEGLRNTINLRGRGGAQGHLHWSNNFDEIQDFEGQIRTLAGGSGLMNDTDFNTGTRSQPLGDKKAGLSADLDALASYLASLSAPDASPFRSATGTLSALANEGKAVYATLNCGSCHGGAAFTNSAVNNPANIGTIKASTGKRLSGTITGIDIPTLRDLWSTAPYLHDGSAATLVAAVRAHNNVSVSDADVTKLSAYLREIGSDEASAPVPATFGTIWPGTVVPTNLSANDMAAVNLGVKFRSDVDGYITGIRFYKGAGNTGTHVGTLWTAAGVQLATATFVNETASGWQQVNFAVPVAVTANTVYVASYLAPTGRYAFDSSYFATEGFDNPPLHALSEGVNGGNGVYAYASATTFPASSYRSTNYWVDVVFTTDTSLDITAPTVTAIAPAGAATGVPLNGNVSATFSEAMNASTVGASTMSLRNTAGTLIPASVSYNAATFVATLTPLAALASSTTYTMTVAGGASGVKDTAGNPLAANRTWSFTTLAVDATPPTVTTVTPASAATGVATTSSISATFSEAMNASTVGTSSFTLRDSSGTLIPATMSYNSTSFVATLTPLSALAGSTTYTATVTGGGAGVRDTAGNALSVNRTWSFTTMAVDTAPPTVTATTPANAATGVAAGSSISATFSESMSAGTINGSTFVLRNAGGAVVQATVSYNATTFIATLTPSAALAGSTGFTVTLTGGAAGIKDSAGNAMAGSPSWTFTTAGTIDTTPPTLTSSTPANGSTAVAVGSAVTATFSEAIDPASISSNSFELRAGATLIASTVTYNAGVATLTPNAALAASTTYTATVRGGASEPRVKDLTGNALAANVSWSFTTAAASACPCTVWPDLATPAVAAANDSGSVNLGVKFTSEQSGFITGIRFYKGSGNTGTHVGALWTSAGVQLASATFVNETATGWQQVNFATPVPITANTVYVASYLAPNGRYAINYSGFSAASVHNPPLRALQDGASGGNGMFAYGSSLAFPTSTYLASNYWVDVVFTP